MLRFSIFIFALSLCACGSEQQTKDKFIAENTAFAAVQTELMLSQTGAPDGKYPRTTNAKGEFVTTSKYDWTPGFFPGTLWYLYELTEDEKWRDIATEWTESLESLQTFTKHHDLGFMMYCSYGNAARLDPKPEYDSIIVRSAESLCTRFHPGAGVIKSWEQFKAWDGLTVAQYPVIIDNMMNLEMLFYASRVSGNEKYADIAKKHALATIKNHFREDYSTYHVIGYDTLSGNAIYKKTAQGFADNSTWARGQAWAIYGYTMMYRETGDKEYLDVAVKATDWYVERLPEDLVPYWDFNAGEEGFTPEVNSYAAEYQGLPRDASAAAIVCSALFELDGYAPGNGYRDMAVRMLHSLSSPAYRAPEGTNAGFMLMHCVGSIPHHNEIDVPLVYADYYFMEALIRYKNSEK